MLKLLNRYTHQSYFVVLFCVGIILGVIIAIIWRVNVFASVLWLWVAIFLLVLSYFSPKLVFVLVAMIAGIIMAFYRVNGELGGMEYVRGFYGKDVIVSGVVDGDPVLDDGELKMKIRDLEFGNEKVKVKGSLYMKLRDSVDVRRADRIMVSGEILEGFGVYEGYMYKPAVKEVLRTEPGDLVLKIRNWFAERIKRLIPEPESELGLSYLLGMKTGLPKELNENLRVVGLTHVVVASGMHLSILVEVAKKLFGRWSRFAGVFFSGLFVLFFMAMVGWTPSIMRAGIMSILTLMTWYVGRRIAPWRLILMVMAFTLMINPMFVIDLGWLLSFASYAGIMIIGPKLIRYFYGTKKPGFVGSMVLVTVSATVMTLPITLYFYGTMSLISVVANLLILPTLPMAMGCVFMAGVVAGIPGVEQIVGLVATRILDFHIMVVEWLGGMREFLVEIPQYQWWVFLIYALIIGLMMFDSKKFML